MKKSTKLIYALLFGMVVLSGCNKTNNVDLKKSDSVSNSQNSVNTVSIPETSINTKDILSELKGKWISEKYSKTLESQKNEKSVYPDVEHPYLEISKNNNQYGLFCSESFHEGYDGFIKNIKPTSKENCYELIFDDEQLANQLIYITKTNNIINRITYCEENYIRIHEEPEVYVNKIVLAGKYKDKKGNQYLFNDNQTARWTDKSFTYEIILDSIQSNGNFGLIFVKTEESKKDSVENNPLYYGFKINGNKLYIYKTKEIKGGQLTILESPFLVLER